ncbi:class I SAM-dependent methyltransferase [bacterium]|nr:class I SAM-dependent methyltransferase [bacterium]
MKSVLKKIFPKKARRKIQNLLQVERRYAKRLAATSKRVDICAAQVAHNFHLAGHPPLAGKVCLEIGSGWILSHALVFHLLGAERVIATDIARHAYPGYLYPALHESVIHMIRDMLSPFDDHARIRERLDRILAIRRFDWDALRGLGIEYRAPIDFAEERLNEPVDFIYSNSVMEHVPCDRIRPVLENLMAGLNPGGTMIHCIHLEDHKNFVQNPFDFFSVPTEEYPAALETSRGNRIRSSGWRTHFDGLSGSRSTFYYEYSRMNKPLPQQIDPALCYKNEADLRVSHIGVYTCKD